MNRVVLKPVPRQYTLYCVHPTTGGYTVRAKVIDDATGKVLSTVDVDGYNFKEQAQERIVTLIKMKVERKGMEYILEKNVPCFVRKHFEDEDVEVVSNEELLASIEAAKRERYVVFKDISGLEDRFDLGVQYLAVDTGFTETMDVTDKYGETCTCFTSRFESVELTEEGKKLEEIQGRMPDSPYARVQNHLGIAMAELAGGPDAQSPERIKALQHCREAHKECIDHFPYVANKLADFILCSKYDSYSDVALAGIIREIDEHAKGRPAVKVDRSACPDCDGKGEFMMCKNHDRDCAVREECFAEKCSCTSQDLEVRTCITCKGTGRKITT